MTGCLRSRAKSLGRKPRRTNGGRVVVSRILSNGVPFGRSFLSSRLRGTPRLRGMRLIPGMCSACAGRPRRTVIPVLSCTARGLSCPLDCSRGGGLLPRLFTLASRRTGRRYVFCDTFRGGELASVGPALSRGVLPRGVRTFLCAEKPRSDRRPPAAKTIACIFHFGQRRFACVFICDGRNPDFSDSATSAVIAPYVFPRYTDAGS